MDDRDVLEPMKVNNNDSCPPIIKEEFKKVLMNMKDGKAIGIDGITFQESGWRHEQLTICN